MDILENLKAKENNQGSSGYRSILLKQWKHALIVHGLILFMYGLIHMEKLWIIKIADVTPVIAKLHKAGKGVIGMKLIGNGTFKNDSGKIDASLKYVLELGTVNMIIVGFELAEQIDNYIGRMRKVPL